MMEVDALHLDKFEAERPHIRVLGGLLVLRPVVGLNPECIGVIMYLSHVYEICGVWRRCLASWLSHG